MRPTHRHKHRRSHDCVEEKKRNQKLVFVPLSWGRAVFTGFLSPPAPNPYISFVMPPQTSILISTSRDKGTVKGRVTFTPTGLQLGNVGDRDADWDVTFATILTRPDAIPPNPVVVVVYLMLNNQFISFTGGSIQEADRASFAALEPTGIPMIAQRNVKLANVPGGTTLSLAGANVSSENPFNIAEIQWSIAAVELVAGVRLICECTCRSTKKQ